ncbi:glycosyltransferase family 39 protein [Alienimonas sp. DA493]|uniref:glycosyltransferase family 39 protein n=1 Tax=Alienimonas sp. DA493 TaxID=3373605 RepID=UPI003753FAB1
MSTVPPPSKVGSTAAPSTDPGSRSRLWWATSAVALVAVATRGALAWQLDAVCRDAHFYEMLADRMRAGDLDGAFHKIELNLYVAVLALLRAAGEATGFGGTNAALAWGVLVAGLTVFPLFDWWKRQFGVGVAVAGIATFAVHPAFTETGVEPIRDGTFWLLVACTFAACHRAAEPQLNPPAGGGPTPPRWRWFLLAGLAATAATLTRTEGWLLFAVLLGWTAVAAWRRPADRPRLLGGATAAVATVPATLLAVNLTLLHGHSRWEWGRLAVLRHMFRWTRRKLIGTLANSPAADPAAHADAVAQAPVFQDAAVAATDPHALTSAAEAGDPLWLVYAEGLLGAYKPVFLLLCGVGLLWYWRRMLRPDALPCWCVSLGVMAAVYQRLAQHGEINGRYFLLPALLSLPVVGLLLNDAVRWAWAFLPSRDRAGAVRSPVRRWWRTAFVGTALSVLAVLHVVDGQQADHPGRDAELHVAAVLGDRLEESLANEPAAAPRVWGVGAAARLVKEMERGLEDRGLDGEVRTAFDGVPIEEAAAARPDLIVLPRNSGRSFDFALTGPEWLAAGFRVLPPPPVHKGRLNEREIAERNIWNGLVVLVPEDAGLGRTPAAATAADAAGAPPGPSAPATPQSPTEPQTGIRAAASSRAARYAGALDGSGPPEFSARR